MKSEKNQNNIPLDKIYQSNTSYSNNLSSLISKVYSIPNLNNYKINYYPLFPFLSYEKTNYSNDKNQNYYNFSLGMQFLNDNDKFNNYINILNQQKSWQQFSSYLISNINNAEKNIILKNSIKSFIGTKKNRDNEKIKLDEKEKNLRVQEKNRKSLSFSGKKITKEKAENGIGNDIKKIIKKDLLKSRKNIKFNFKRKKIFKKAIKSKIKKSTRDFSIIINNSNYKNEQDNNLSNLLDKNNKKESSENIVNNNKYKITIFPK